MQTLKSTLLLLFEALQSDPGDMYAAQLYIQEQPDLSARIIFVGLVVHVQTHAHNQSITAQGLHYSPALAAHIAAPQKSLLSE